MYHVVFQALIFRFLYRVAPPIFFIHPQIIKNVKLSIYFFILKISLIFLQIIAHLQFFRISSSLYFIFFLLLFFLSLLFDRWLCRHCFTYVYSAIFFFWSHMNTYVYTYRQLGTHFFPQRVPSAFRGFVLFCFCFLFFVFYERRNRVSVWMTQ